MPLNLRTRIVNKQSKMLTSSNEVIIMNERDN